jgi:hypothetical protein
VSVYLGYRYRHNSEKRAGFVAAMVVPQALGVAMGLGLGCRV